MTVLQICPGSAGPSARRPLDRCRQVRSSAAPVNTRPTGQAEQAAGYRARRPQWTNGKTALTDLRRRGIQVTDEPISHRAESRGAGRGGASAHDLRRRGRRTSCSSDRPAGLAADPSGRPRMGDARKHVGLGAAVPYRRLGGAPTLSPPQAGTTILANTGLRLYPSCSGRTVMALAGAPAVHVRGGPDAMSPVWPGDANGGHAARPRPGVHRPALAGAGRPRAPEAGGVRGAVRGRDSAARG
ncbi:MAG: hypothetical protein ACI9K2_007501 [Myxococcota bacterium]